MIGLNRPNLEQRAAKRALYSNHQGEHCGRREHAAVYPATGSTAIKSTHEEDASMRRALSHTN